MPILEILYFFSALLLAVYGFNSLLLTLIYRHRKPDEPYPAGSAPEDWPAVTVQLPVYNERHVVKRLIEAVVNLNWPAGRLQIQILDDSTDDTRQLIAATIAFHQANGAQMQIEHLHRIDRQGFKAGALQEGMASATGEFIAIFDADFIPPPNFLRQVIPCFDNERVGCVQTRWGHINPESSRLTQAQALGIDGHFIVEQTARHAIKAFLNFNGTAGAWRKSCMLDAGGWLADTLTEDLDLSYRAQLRGWHIIYQPQVIVPAELPVQLNAFKRQQFRWAKGSIQTAKKLLIPLWKAEQPLWLKLMGTLHLTNYAVHPLMLLNLLLTLPMTMSDSFFLLLTPFFTISAIGPPILYWTTMRGKTLPLSAKLNRLAILIATGTGLSLNNSKAVAEAIFNKRSDFKRTPKFAVTDRAKTWQTSAYALPRNPIAWLELLLALYALFLLGWIVTMGIWWLVPWMGLYAGGYSYISGLAFLQVWETRAAQLSASHKSPAIGS